MNKNFFGILFSILVSFSAQAQLDEIFGASNACMEAIRNGMNSSKNYGRPEDVNSIYMPYAEALRDYHITDGDFASDPDTPDAVKKRVRESLKRVIGARLEVIFNWYPRIAENIDLTCKIDQLLLKSWDQDPNVGGINDPNNFRN